MPASTAPNPAKRTKSPKGPAAKKRSAVPPPLVPEGDVHARAGTSAGTSTIGSQVMETLLKKIDQLSNDVLELKGKKVPECSVSEPEADMESQGSAGEVTFRGELGSQSFESDVPVYNNVSFHDQRKMIDAGMPLGFTVPAKIKNDI